eukprot:UN03846
MENVNQDGGVAGFPFLTTFVNSSSPRCNTSEQGWGARTCSDLSFTVWYYDDTSSTDLQAEYVAVDSGNCESNGYDYIMDYDECETAAIALGYDTTIYNSGSWGTFYPFACQFGTNLGLNSGDMSSSGSYSECGTPYTCFCKSDCNGNTYTVTDMASFEDR